MTIENLLNVLQKYRVKARLVNGKLKINVPRGVMNKELDSVLKENKILLLDWLKSKDLAHNATSGDTAQVENNAKEIKICPEHLTLVKLTQPQIDELVNKIPGGAANIQDIYPLAPLQEGILYHHLLQEKSIAFVISFMMSFDSKEQLDSFVEALKVVIGRHDILRTSVHWEGLDEPVQVVSKQVHLPLQVLEFDTDLSQDVREQLLEHSDSSISKLDISKAPLMRGLMSFDKPQQRWLLQLSYHHLIMDHVTLELLVKEVIMIQKGQTESLIKPVPFRNFIALTRLNSSKSKQRDFFTEMLSDFDEATVPFSLLDVQGDGFKFVESVLSVDSKLANKIRQQARLQRVSVASIFHLAWAQLLAKTSGRDDVVFGTVLFGRFQGGADTESAMGLFMNTLPLRINIKVQSVAQCLQEVFMALTNLLSYEHASLSLAQQCSNIPNAMPLFSTFLNYRYSIDDSAGDDVIEGMEILSTEDKTNYPFSLSVDDLGEGFELTSHIDQSISSERVCKMMHVTLENIVDALDVNTLNVDTLDINRNVLMQSVDILPKGELMQILNTFNNTNRGFPKDSLIHELFEQQVIQDPDAIALKFQSQTLSYSALNKKANQLANHLIELGVKPDTRVALCLERSFDMVIAILGTLKAGGAYVPFDPAYPADRLSHMISDSEPAVILTQSSLIETCSVFKLSINDASSNCPVVVLDEVPWQDCAWGGLCTQNNQAVKLGLSSSNLAYVIYTSGSTGNPKGVMIEHRSLVNRIDWMQEAYQLGKEETVLQKTPFSFDVSVWEFFWPLGYGAQLFVADPEGHKDPVYLARLINEQQISTLHFVPSMLQAFLLQQPQCPSLKRVICSGEALPVNVAFEAQKLWPNANLYNLYGPTEASIDVTAWRCSPTDKQVPIGYPIANTQIYLLDAHYQPVPLGVSGEIYIGGVGVARGYLNNAELTRERFISDPFSSTTDARMYQTGDLGRWLPDGSLEYLGRNDFQVKMRGFRIELGEIEVQLCKVQGIRESAVIAREDTTGDKRLVAYVVLDNAATGHDSGLDFDTKIIAAALGAHLPEYMIPTATVVMPSLPLTSNGKLDRKALPAPTNIMLKQVFREPKTKVEDSLVKIWSKLLRLETHDVSTDVNFIEYGGDSLLSIRLISEIRQQFKVELAIKNIHEHPTIQSLALIIEDAIALLSLKESIENSLVKEEGVL